MGDGDSSQHQCKRKVDVPGNQEKERASSLAVSLSASSLSLLPPPPPQYHFILRSRRYYGGLSELDTTTTRGCADVREAAFERRDEHGRQDMKGQGLGLPMNSPTLPPSLYFSFVRFLALIMHPQRNGVDPRPRPSTRCGPTRGRRRRVPGLAMLQGEQGRRDAPVTWLLAAVSRLCSPPDWVLRPRFGS